MKKVQIHQFDPVIYPYKIWVIINPTPNIISDTFTEYSGSNVIFTEEDGTSRMNAFVMMAKHKESKFYGSIVYFRSKKSMDYGLVSHESSHAAKQVFKHIGADILPDEPFEYMVEFIADCCNQVRTNKFK